MLVNKNSKSFESTLFFSCKSSWDYYSKRESDLAVLQWRMYFQVADSRGKSFFDLLDNECNPIKPLNIKGSL